MVSIDEQIGKLPAKTRDRLEAVMIDLLEYDKYWCKRHEIDILHPDVAKARRKVYELYFKDAKSN